MEGYWWYNPQGQGMRLQLGGLNLLLLFQFCGQVKISVDCRSTGYQPKGALTLIPGIPRKGAKTLFPGAFSRKEP